MSWGEFSLPCIHDDNLTSPLSDRKLNLRHLQSFRSVRLESTIKAKSSLNLIRLRHSSKLLRACWSLGQSFDDKVFSFLCIPRFISLPRLQFSRTVCLVCTGCGCLTCALLTRWSWKVRMT